MSLKRIRVASSGALTKRIKSAYSESSDDGLMEESIVGNTILDDTATYITAEIMQEGSLGMSAEDAQLVHNEVGEVSLAEHVDGLDDEGIVTAVEEVQAMEASEVMVGESAGVIIQHMDIALPLSTLRRLLETRLGISLEQYEFFLQDNIQLDDSRNLVSQCVAGSGMVQINLEIKDVVGPRINILDILKPAEEIEEVIPNPTPIKAPARVKPRKKVVIPFPEENENVTRWIVDQNFRKEQEQLNIPFDPRLWDTSQVEHWLNWAIEEFKLQDVDKIGFQNISGAILCDLKHDSFAKLVPIDRNDIFWTHLELLRKCKFVAVIQQPTPHAITTITVSTSSEAARAFGRQKYKQTILPSERGTPGNRTGNNGQIQLWQFLLDLLTDKECQEIIQWVGDGGEFKLHNPELVARMWGQRKNKPNMNYEKLSRALRYYYDGDMIAKVHGKRFVYKFVCDLRMLMGYSAAELNRRTTDCAERHARKVETQLLSKAKFQGSYVLE